MAQGYLVTLGDGNLDVGDVISGSLITFDIDETLGGGSWTWSGTYTANGSNYTNITDTGTYFEATDGNVYFTPTNWFVDPITSATTTAVAPYPATPVVEGGNLADVIDGTFTDGDFDSLTAGDDVIDGGRGDDTITSTDGNETVYGGAGSDTVTTGAGSDTIFGDSSVGTSSSGESMNWSAQGGDGTDLSAGFTQTTGGMNVTVTVNDLGGLNNADMDTRLQYVEGTEPFSETSSLRLTGDGNGGSGVSTTAEIEFVFSDDTGGDNSDEVENVQFRINDIDQSSWDDRVTVLAFDALGNPVTVTFTISGDETLLGDGETLDGAGNDNADQVGGSVLIDIAGPVARVEIFYSNGGSGGQALWLTDMHFDVIQLVTDNDDVINSGAGDDFVYAEQGDDTVNAGDGDDTVDGGSGDDTLYGEADDDTIDGGTGDDTIEGGTGDDTITGGDDNDTLSGDDGDDVFVLGEGFGVDDIDGGANAQTDGDTLDASSMTSDLTLDLTAVSATDNESGTLTEGGNVATFGEIENVILGSGDDTFIGSTGDDNVDMGSGTDTVDAGEGDDTINLGGDGAGGTDGDADVITFSNGDGNDTILNFDGPLDLGGGVFTGIDTIDVSDMSDGYGSDVNTDDVAVSDDGSGNAVLTFPNGETMTLMGVTPAQLSTPEALAAIGIPLAGTVRDGIVSGNGDDNIIDGTYNGDPDGDIVDNGDAIIDGEVGDDDIILAGGGNDTVTAGDGDDYIEGGTGHDIIYGDNVGQSTSVTDTVVVDAQDFEGGANGWTDNTTEIDAGFGEVLGRFEGADGTVATEQTFDLTEDADQAVITFDAHLIDSWDGENFIVTIDGEQFTFAHTVGSTEAATQQIITVGGVTYTVDFTPQGTSAGIGFGGWQDLTVGVTITIDNPNDTVTVGVGSTLNQGVNDESFAIDNFGITVTGPSSGDDEIYGGEGDDTIYGNFGDDIIDGGSGDDTIVLETGFDSDTITGGETGETNGDVLDSSSIGANQLLDLTSDETGTISDGTDTTNFTEIEQFILGSGNDTVSGSNGGDNVDMGAGDDTITAGSGGDVILGGAGDDTVIIGNGFGDDTITGGETGETNGDVLDASAVTDNLTLDISTPEQGTLTNDTDTIDFDEIEQFILGSGDDDVTGSAGSDNVVLGAGDDTMDGGAGADIMSGGDGDDTFVMGNGFGADDIDGGNGGETNGDVLDASSITDNLTLDISTPETGTLSDGTDSASFADIEEFFTGSGNDTVTGSDGDDVVSTGAGDDVITTGEGSDTIDAGDGDDTITFSQGDDITGGQGNDTFILEELGEAGTDGITITGGGTDGTDFDTLQLGSNAIWSTLSTTPSASDAGGFDGTITLDDGTELTFTGIENIICFTTGAQIATPRGARPVEDLKVGDMVVTRDHGLQPIRWMGQRTVPAVDRFAPVLIGKNVLAGAERDILVSPQHRMLFQGYRSELLFGESEVLVAAKHLINDKDVVQQFGGMVTYFHIMFDHHEIVFADGASSESFHPGGVGLSAIDDGAREELFGLFPELRSNPNGFGQTARRCLKKHDARLIRG